MAAKPTILFIAITPPEYSPADISEYGTTLNFDLIPHKHSVLALVAWLRENGCEGDYFWVHDTGGESLAKLGGLIERIGPHAIGFSLVTEELLANYELIEFLKESHPDLPVIVGGPHVTAEPRHTLENFPLIDFVAIGEGEITLTEWLRKIASQESEPDFSDIDGLAFRDNSGQIVITSQRAEFADINVLPDPAFDLIAGSGADFKRGSAFPLACSYGCSYCCTFCAAANGNYRFLSPKRIVNQIQRAQNELGAAYFAFRDSFWPPSSGWLDEFCDKVEKRGLEFRFHFETRVGALNEEQWARLKSIGLRAVGVGVESGDPGMLKAIKKGITVDMARKTFDILHRLGILSLAFFMYGNQGETRETVKATEALVSELNPTLLSLATFRPLPGTEAFNYVKDEDRDWWMRGTYPTICGFSLEELHKVRAETHIRYPLRWRYLSQNVFFSELPQEYRTIAWRGFRVHLRKYLLGILERSSLMRAIIAGAKPTLKRLGG